MNTIFYRLIVFVLIAVNSPILAQQKGKLTDRQIFSLDSTINDLIARTLTPGVSVAVANGKEIIWSKGFGKADLENEAPARPNTVYRLASVSKPLRQ